MQRTRLSTLFDRLFQQLNQWSQNPWRRISTIVETVSWLTYGSNLGRRRPDSGAILGQRPLWIAILNSLKLGLIYGLFVEAFKLGS